ncbi:Uncharacterized protein DAT39_020335, partial [Clarias magur]
MGAGVEAHSKVRLKPPPLAVMGIGTASGSRKTVLLLLLPDDFALRVFFRIASAPSDPREQRQWFYEFCSLKKSRLYKEEAAPAVISRDLLYSQPGFQLIMNDLNPDAFQ